MATFKRNGGSFAPDYATAPSVGIIDKPGLITTRVFSNVDFRLKAKLKDLPAHRYQLIQFFDFSFCSQQNQKQSVLAYLHHTKLQMGSLRRVGRRPYN